MLVLQDEISQARFFKLLEKDKRVQVFSHLESLEQNKILKQLSPYEIKDLLSEMHLDDRATLFKKLLSIAVRKLLTLLDKESTDKVNKLLGYPENSVGRRMTTDYVAARPTWTVGQVLEHVRN